ncbi:MAG: AraC family transcriptional regulator [Victivallales bacterium]
MLIKTPIEYVSGVWKFTRTPRRDIKARSTPDHLLHLVVSGSYTLKTNGRIYEIKPGSIIYYYASEDVEWIESKETVVFYSVAFKSERFKTLSFENRVLKAGKWTVSAFERLYEYSLSQDEHVRAMGIYSSLLGILVDIQKATAGKDGENSKSEAADIWNNIEQRIRTEKKFRAQLDELCGMSHKSRATLIRICKKSTGESPIRRIRNIRMAEADGLLHFSTLNITQISEYLGYPRIHEFSREFKKYFGVSPTSRLDKRVEK